MIRLRGTKNKTKFLKTTRIQCQDHMETIYYIQRSGINCTKIRNVEGNDHAL